MDISEVQADPDKFTYLFFYKIQKLSTIFKEYVSLSVNRTNYIFVKILKIICYLINAEGGLRSWYIL